MVFTKQNCKYMQRNSFWDWCKISDMKCTLYNSILFWNEMNFRFFCHQDTNKRKKHHRFYVTQHILCIIFCRQISFCYIKFSHIPQTYTFMVRLWKFHGELQRLWQRWLWQCLDSACYNSGDVKFDVDAIAILLQHSPFDAQWRGQKRPVQNQQRSAMK